MIQNDIKDGTNAQNTEQNAQILSQSSVEPTVTNDSSNAAQEPLATASIDELKAHYEATIAEIRAEKEAIEQEYKTFLIKEHLQKLEANVELLYFVMKGRGDIDKISYKNGTIEGLDELISIYKQDANTSELFISKSQKIGIDDKTPRTRAINPTARNAYEKEKSKICSDWCS